eukprot:UN25719
MTDTEITRILLYASGFYGNMGNYLSFGDTKFIPNVPQERFELFISCCDAWTGQKSDDLVVLCDMVKDSMYSLTQRERQIGLGKEKGISTYYSADCERSDAEFIQKFLDKYKIEAYNTRCFKTGPKSYTITVLCSNAPMKIQTHRKQHRLERGVSNEANKMFGYFKFEDCDITVESGDLHRFMKGVVDNVHTAKDYCSGRREWAMLDGYEKSFRGGSIDDHKEGSKHWVTNKGPNVETYIGLSKVIEILWC